VCTEGPEQSDRLTAFCLFVISPLLLVIAAIASWRLNYQIIERLRTHHASTWEALRRPTLFQIWLRPLDYWVGGTRSYFGWLLFGLYTRSGDERLTVLGNRHIALFTGICLLLLCWTVTTWISGYLHGR
jgi:hypothetical protein